MAYLFLIPVAHLFVHFHRILHVYTIFRDRIDAIGLMVVSFPRTLSFVVREPARERYPEEREKEKERGKVTFPGIEKRKDPPATNCDFSPSTSMFIFLFPRLVHVVLGRSSTCFILQYFRQRISFVISFFFSLSLFLFFLDTPSISVTKFTTPFNVEAAKGSFEDSLDI